MEHLGSQTQQQKGDALTKAKREARNTHTEIKKLNIDDYLLCLQKILTKKKKKKEGIEEEEEQEV